MKRDYFQKIIDVLVLITLCFLIFVSFTTLQNTFHKPAVVTNQPVAETSDLLNEQKIVVPVVGFINGINPDAKIEFEKFEMPPEPPISSNVTTSKNTVDKIGRAHV
jgi:hypothetical protein